MDNFALFHSVITIPISAIYLSYRWPSPLLTHYSTMNNCMKIKLQITGKCVALEQF